MTAARILGLDGARLTQALGIAGSLCGGLLAFAPAGNGAMVKRLHLGRAAESGILAARLAEGGFEGPDMILEGKFGFLQTYCTESDPALLTEGLGTRFEMGRLCIKRYPCHVTAHTPLVAIEALRPPSRQPCRTHCAAPHPRAGRAGRPALRTAPSRAARPSRRRPPELRASALAVT